MKTIKIRYGGLVDALMRGAELDAPDPVAFKTDEDRDAFRRERRAEAAATRRALAMLIANAYGTDEYRAVFDRIGTLVDAGPVNGHVALRLLDEYGEAE